MTIKAGIIVAPIALSLAALGPAAASAPRDGVDPYFGDGGTSDFYRWSAALARPGLMLRQEPVGEGFYVDNASIARRILYSSTDGRFGRGVVEASGLLYLPKGTPPEGGWPLLVWGHGTFGIADVCAPSWKKPTPRDGTYVDAWLRQGYAVVAPDYQGLGTPGVHPYLQRKPEGYSVLDAARAAIAAYPAQVANRVILAGQSQGAGAVLNATAVANEYAPDVRLLGTIATALVWRASDEPDPSGDVLGDDAPRYLVMRMMGGGLKPDSPPPDRILTAKGGLLRDAAATSCSRDLIPVAQSNNITGSNAFIPSPTAMAAMLGSLAAPRRRLPVPIFIATGLADGVIPADGQYRAVRALCRASNRVVWRKYAGITHSGTSNYALRDAIPFAAELLRGGRPDNDCKDLQAPGPLEPPARDIPFND